MDIVVTSLPKASVAVIKLPGVKEEALAVRWLANGIDFLRPKSWFERLADRGIDPAVELLKEIRIKLEAKYIERHHYYNLPCSHSGFRA